MAQQRIGVAVTAADSNAALATVEDLERRGISAAWMTSGSAGGGDALSVFAAAGTRTRDIMMGTAITQTFPRHPIAVAPAGVDPGPVCPRTVPAGAGHQRAGRDGANHRGQLPRSPGPPARVYTHPQGTAPGGFGGPLRSLLPGPQQHPGPGGRAGDGRRLGGQGLRDLWCRGRRRHQLGLPPFLPARRCPARHAAGAERADREVPPLVAHVPVCVHDDPEEARQAVAQQFRGFARAPFYVNMFAAAGFPEVSEGSWSEGMVDAVAVWGNESQVSEGLQGMLAMGATELMASPVAAGADSEASLERTLGVLAQVSRSLTG